MKYSVDLILIKYSYINLRIRPVSTVEAIVSGSKKQRSSSLLQNGAERKKLTANVLPR